MTTRSYEFTLTDRSTPRNRVFAWHWHPTSKRSSVTHPHVHLPKATPFANAHVPTGRVSIEDIVLFGFQDLGVPPAIENAQAIVEEAMRVHKKYRAWS